MRCWRAARGGTMHRLRTLAVRIAVLAVLAVPLRPVEAVGTTLPDPRAPDAAPRWIDRTVELVKSAPAVKRLVTSSQAATAGSRREEAAASETHARSCPTVARHGEDESAAARYVKLMRAR